MAAFKFFGKKKQKPSKKHAKPHKVKRKKAVVKPVKEIKAKITVEKMPDVKAYELLKKYKVPVVDYFFVKNEKEIQPALKKLGFPVVMKVSGDILHKTEVGGIRKNIQSYEQALSAFKDLIKIKGANSVLIQKQLSGIEMIVGSKKDPQFGYVIVTGLGGIYVEVLKDVTFRIAPLSLQDAENMVSELKGLEILKGARGTKPINFSALYETLTKVSRLAVNEKIKELDINPLFCDEHGCFAADVRIVK